MTDWTRDIAYAWRTLKRAPAFTLVAVITLALGIGANATIFSLVSAVLFRPLPVERPSELVNIYGHSDMSTDHGSISYPNYLDYRAQTTTLSGLIAHTNFFANLSIEGSAELVVGEVVSDNYFEVLGVQPAAGRGFVPEEFAAPGAGPVAILSHPFWQSRFAGDRDVLGRSVRLNGISYTIVGITPEDFGGMFPAVTAQMWIPLSMVDQVEPVGNQRSTGGGATFLDSRGRHFLWLRGRMRPGTRVAQVAAEFDAIAAGLATRYPEANQREQISVIATNDVAINPDFDGTIAPAGLVLLVAVALVLLVACANLANMTLSRAATRARELAVRVAIGAGRARIVRQMLTESVIVALAGGAAAMLIAQGLTVLIARFQPPLPINIALRIEPDWRVLVFTFIAAVATGITFGLVPALRASQPDLVPALKDTGEGVRRPGRRVELRDALVVAQLAFSLLLLVVGTLMVRSLGAAARVDMGYDVDRTAFLGLALEMNGYGREDGGVFVETGKRRLQAMQGVEAVGLASRVPQSVNNNGFGLFVDGHPSTLADRPITLDGARIDEDYLDALGLRIVEGRGIEPADRDELRRVAVVTATMARQIWPDAGSFVGREFRLSRDGQPYAVVGVVEDYKVDTPGEAPKPYLHLPLARDLQFANFIVRTGAPAAGVVTALERELRSLDPDLVFLETGTLRDLVALRTFPILAGAWLIGAFGVLALVLAAVGLYGVIAYSVNRRVREIGIRKAIGAQTGQVLGMVMRRGMALVAVGGLIGAALAAAGAQVLGSVLFVGAFDPLSFAIAFAVLATVATLANWAPALRASRIDPMVALRGS